MKRLISAPTISFRGNDQRTASDPGTFLPPPHSRNLLPRAVSSYDVMRTSPSEAVGSISVTMRQDRREGSSYQGSVRAVSPTPAQWITSG